MGARETALNALIACRKGGGWSNGILKEYIRRDRLGSRDAALATRLCYGVLQNRAKLDYYLQQLLSGRLKDLQPVVRDILHLGLYQLSELDKVPDSAAVNEAVNLTKKYSSNPKAASLVNGVLRTAVRTKGTWQEPVAYEDRYSHPAELIALLKKAVPKGMLEPMLRANNAAPETVIQVNTLKTTPQLLINRLAQEGVTARTHCWMTDALELSGTGNLERLSSFQEGLYYVQDPAARLAVQCARLQGEKPQILDCCASPGGKSFAAAIALGDRGTVFSCDVHPHKVALLQNGARRLGLRSITPMLQDATQHRLQWVGAMDAVLCDVPCSGLGIIRKKPDIRYKDLSAIASLPDLQLAILSNVSTYVKPGGTLLYSTCTVLPQENEEVVAAFLARHPQFQLEQLDLPSVFPENTSGMLTLLPGQYHTDGFFISRLRRDL